jgi:glycosyltransferase involved in cell wall biosynthesis
MKICLVGGIFDRGDLRAKSIVTPETVLLDGFEQAGVSVDAVGHSRFQLSKKYDVVHVHHFGRAAFQIAAAASSHRPAFVFTGHNGLIVTNYERSKIRKYAFQFVVRNADAVVALSQAEANYYAERKDPTRVHLIPNGIPAEIFRRSDPTEAVRDHSEPKAQFTILYVGQLIDWKGIDFLFPAFKSLRRKWPVRLRLVYHNPHLEGRYRRMADDLEIAGDVDFVGIRSPSQLVNEYRSADVLVLPSFADCLPSVVTESLLCGTPVVASAVCGIPEQVGKYGRLVPPGDTVALSEAIDGLLTDSRQFLDMADEMRAYAEVKYNPQVMVNAHLALYEQLIGHSPLARRTSSLDRALRVGAGAYWAPASSQIRLWLRSLIA